MIKSWQESAFLVQLWRVAAAALLVSTLQTVAAQAATDLSIVDAAKAQDWAEVQALLNSGGRTDVDAVQPDGATALAWSAYWDDTKTAKRLLRSGADANAANDYGVTPLFLACQNHSLQMVKALLDGGADPDRVLWSGVAPLMVAAKSGETDIVRALIDADADVNAPEPRRGQSALMWAISFGYPDAARVLIEAGADVTARTMKLNEDYSPMQLEAYTKSVSGTAQGGYTPLMFAARQGDVATTRLLLDRGADVNAESAVDGSSLVIASVAGHEDLSLLLLDAGADPASVDAGGMTALHFALRDGLKILHGYNITEGALVCNFGGDPTRCKPLAVLSDKELEFLDDPEKDLILDEDENDLREPLPGRNMHRLAVALLDEGADANAAMQFPPPHLRLARLSMFNMTGATPFFLAAAAQDVDAMDMMLVREDVDALVETSINEEIFYKQLQVKADDNEIQANATTLMVAIGLGRKSDFSPDEEARAIRAAEKLIARGADVNAATATGWTPMHAAAYIGAEAMIEFLVANGADINVMTGCGQTPMSFALGISVAGLLDRTVPQVETAELLLDLGAANVSADKAVGDCVLGRGGLEADIAQNQLVKDRIAEVERKMQARQ
ncbi:MAG: ankyrin repeat domain-containing protein [Proteobacteria bacterium]|nr:ankyrin repeat domain-containing protein [Pseudomonadota bacterium]